MADAFTLYIDDQGIPACHRAVLAAALAPAGQMQAVRFLTDCAVTPVWNDVPRAQASSLTQLLQLLADTEAGKFIWLKGSQLITGRIADPFSVSIDGISGVPGLRLGLQELVIADQYASGMQAIREKAAAILAGDFNLAINAILEMAPLPSGFVVGGWNHPDRGIFASCSGFTARPWLAAAAPGARAWEADIAVLMQKGVVTAAMLEVDVDAGLLRPSILTQAHGSMGLTASLPCHEARMIDAMLPQSELRLSPWRLQTMQTVRYAVPRLLSQPARPRELPRKRWIDPETPAVAVTLTAQRLELLRTLLSGSWRYKLQALYLITRFFLKLPFRMLRAILSPETADKRKSRFPIQIRRTLLQKYKRGRSGAKRLYHYGKYASLHPRRTVSKLFQRLAGR